MKNYCTHKNELFCLRIFHIFSFAIGKVRFMTHHSEKFHLHLKYKFFLVFHFLAFTQEFFPSAIDMSLISFCFIFYYMSAFSLHGSFVLLHASSKKILVNTNNTNFLWHSNTKWSFKTIFTVYCWWKWKRDREALIKFVKMFFWRELMWKSNFSEWTTDEDWKENSLHT